MQHSINNEFNLKIMYVNKKYKNLIFIIFYIFKINLIYD